MIELFGCQCVRNGFGPEASAAAAILLLAFSCFSASAILSSKKLGDGRTFDST